MEASSFLMMIRAFSLQEIGDTNTEERAGGFFSDIFSSLPSSSSSSFSASSVFGQADDLESSRFGYTTDPDLGNANDDSQWLNVDSGSDLVSDAVPLNEVSSSCIGEDEDSSSSSILTPYFGKKNKKMRPAIQTKTITGMPARFIYNVGQRCFRVRS